MPPTKTDSDFWWLRYFCGLALPIPLALYGVFSMITRHSYTFWRRSGFVPVTGFQAVLVGMAYLGLALILFANCYAQYHEKMAYHYQWFLAPGAILTVVGSLWCTWIFIAG
jgi:hypothetical protein